MITRIYKLIITAVLMAAIHIPGWCQNEYQTDKLIAEHKSDSKKNLKRWKKYYLSKAKLYFSDKEYEKASRIDEDLMQLNLSKKEMFTISARLGKSFIALGKYEKAINYFNMALESGKKNPDILFELAKSYEGVDILEEALKYYKLCVKNDKHFWMAYVGLGRIYWRQGLMDMALMELGRVFDMGKANIETYNLASLVLEKLNDIPRAIEMQEKSLEIEIRPEYHSRIGYLHFTNNQYEKAASAYKKALAIDPLDDEAVLYLGIVNFRSGNNKTAETYFNQTIKMDRTNAVAYFFLAVISQQKNDIKKALQYLDKVFEYAQSKQLVKYSEKLSKEWRAYSNR
ncbi:MAG: tetratricopeptide repeat protein [bacterium]